ncbi:MAG: glycosyltransferase [Planctomycetota bacterium]
MRILYFVTHFPSFSETFVLHEMTALIERGHDVSVLARAPVAGPLHEAYEKHRMGDRVRYIAPLEPNRVVRVARSLPPLARGLRDRPVTTLRALDPRRLGIRAATLEPLHAADAVRRDHRFDIAHAHFAAPGVTACMLKGCGALTCPVVTTFHDIGALTYVKSWGPRAYDQIWRYGDLHLMTSRGCLEGLAEFGCPRERAAVHHVGIDLERLAFAPSRDSSPPWRLLYVGRLTEGKGCHLVLRTLRGLLDDGIDATLRIVGDGAERARFEALSHELEVTARTEFTGAQPNSVVVDEMRRAHALLAPSYRADDGKDEVIPVTLMEAMAVGAPVVTTTNGSIAELVEHDVSGLIVPERGQRELDDAVRRLLADRVLRGQLARGARAVVEERHSHHTQVDRLETMFERLASGRDTA